MKISKASGFVGILASALIAWSIANVGVDYNKMELGALAPLYIPAVFGIGTLIFFAIVDFFIEKPRTIIVVLLMSLNIYIGMTIRMQQ
ncbi:MAG TPA: hypothetical protein VE978_19265 [Chitinophagales bacterium]|nr:hypothetical protein [Chitinophagales bacterium]